MDMSSVSPYLGANEKQSEAILSVPVRGEEALDVLMYQVLFERASVSEVLVRNLASSIEKNNEASKDTIELKQKVLNEPEKLTDAEKSEAKRIMGNETYTNLTSDNDEDKDKAKTAASSAFDDELNKLSSTSQLEMVNLQAAMDKYNTAFSAMSNFQQKYNGTVTNVVNNLK